MLLYQIFAFTICRKIKKSQTKTINLKYQLQRGMINLNYLTDCILYQIFKVILSASYFDKNIIFIKNIRKENRK